MRALIIFLAAFYTFSAVHADSVAPLSIRIVQLQEGGEPKPLNNVTVSGTVMTFDMDYDMGGNSMNLQYELNLDGDNLDGQVMVGSFGTFKVKGKRISKPN